MDITEVIELMSMVDSMDNIEEVTVTLGDNPSVTIKKKATETKQARRSWQNGWSPDASLRQLRVG